jgi:hypothetical protein
MLRQDMAHAALICPDHRAFLFANARSYPLYGHECE